MDIEDTMHDFYLPVNTLAMITRLEELLKENKTNSLSDCKKDKRVRKLLWLLNHQFFGGKNIDMNKEWRDLREQ